MNSATAPVRRLAATATPDLPESASQGSRGAILNAALHLFAEHGFEGASMRDIATASGIQPATIYSHFPSKQHLLAELVGIGHAEHYRRTSTALLECQPTPAAQVVAFVQAHVRMHAELSMLAVVANAELHALKPEIGGHVFQLREQSTQQLQTLIERGMAGGDFAVEDAWLATAAIGGMGLRVAYWYGDDSDQSVDGIAHTYARFALRILGVADTHPDMPREPNGP